MADQARHVTSRANEKAYSHCTKWSQAETSSALHLSIGVIGMGRDVHGAQVNAELYELICKIKHLLHMQVMSNISFDANFSKLTVQNHSNNRY